MADGVLDQLRQRVIGAELPELLHDPFEIEPSTAFIALQREAPGFTEEHRSPVEERRWWGGQ
ncbi:hypothetical protein BE15_04675 [Sorangium cellulosum]|uniref:Uncharacterized protein n=1 Tax=Sorangium cellulosum TaxID=56 RepID=A0A150QYD8_SORCE|nr:hypothetical protein BE15_04675 [Sorangium cellulosum]